MRKTTRLRAAPRRVPLRARRVVAGVVLLGVAVGMAPAGPARSTEPLMQSVGHLDLRLPATANSQYLANSSLVVDSAARRGYQLVLRGDNATLARSFDLDTGEIVLERVLPASAFPSGPAAPHSAGNSSEWAHAFDADRRVLYVAFRSGGNFAGVSAIDVATLDVAATFRRTPAALPDQVGCTSQSCLPQTPTAQPQIKGMSFVPPVLTGGPPKLLLAMQEPGSSNVQTVVWVAQWDAVTGRQDWIYRVRACANNSLVGGSILTRYQVPVFQARLGTGIYIPCQAGGGTAQVVRLVVDANNQPTAELVYPGPLTMTDALADVEDDRTLLRVTLEEGETWWVFDGRASAYTGVVGATVEVANTAAGLHPESGRLYLQVPATTFGRRQDPGGLLVSDIRRSPAPQALAFEEFSRQGAGKVLVDTHPETGERRVFLLDEDLRGYTIVSDRLPITADPPLRDLDRLTTDVDEGPGTSRSFTGTGRAYGVRTLLVGGPGAVSPGATHISVQTGRQVPVWLGSPCMGGDREVVVGSVRSAGLSNNLSSAAAVVAEVDPGTKTDVGQPSERCYAHPRTTSPVAVDPWHPALERNVSPYPRPVDRDSGDDGTSDADEYLGTRWPFRATECSGDGSDATVTTQRPLDRGGAGDDSGVPAEVRNATGRHTVVPEPLRSQEMTTRGLSASVTCALSQARVDALARAQAFEGPEVPGVGKVTAGEVFTDVDLYLDAQRGLVARSVAAVRDISIGDEIFIDLAFTVGESWAAGRPGTSATEFTRRLCGVRIRDQAPTVVVSRPAVDPGSGTVDPDGGGPVDKSVDVQGCGDPEQPLLGRQPAVDAINRVLGNRGRASVPEPDGELRQGTPGGYLASVQKDRLQQISDRAVNNDASSQVPAVEIVIFNDDPSEGRGRQVYQFAGVDASVTYGIFLLGGGDGAEADFDDVPELLVELTGGRPGVDPDVFADPEYAAPGDGGDGDLADSAVPAGRARDPLIMVFSGLGFLLRSPKDALLAATVIGFLLVPLYLAARRRELRAAGSSS